MAAPATWSQEATSTPSPKELWEAYPLEPGQASATSTPSAEFGAVPSATASRPAAEADDGGMSWIVWILLAAPLVFAAGLLVGHRREAAVATSPAAGDPPAPRAPPKRFQWRDYPEPARPAPPPPPVPVRGAEPERLQTGRFTQKAKEPH